MLTFIIPVRHPENSKDWAGLKARLTQTVASVSNQTSAAWQAIIVANEGSDLPELPKGFSVEWVQFPPNPQHDWTSNHDIEMVRDLFRFDKGRRVRAGMLVASGASHFMTVDDDDFVSCKLARFANENFDTNGWIINRGYVWSEGSSALVGISNFNHLCGTSHIVNARLYDFKELAEPSSDHYVKHMLGSHISVARNLAAKGTPLSSLPFRGAIYRVGHPGAHSKSAGLIRTFVVNRETVRRPHKLVKTMLSLRLITPSLRQEFFG